MATTGINCLVAGRVRGDVRSEYAASLGDGRAEGEEGVRGPTCKDLRKILGKRVVHQVS